MSYQFTLFILQNNYSKNKIQLNYVNKITTTRVGPNEIHIYLCSISHNIMQSNKQTTTKLIKPSTAMTITNIKYDQEK